MRTQIRFLAAAAALTSACLSSAQALGDDSTGAARSALEKVRSWLEAGKNAEAWESYLNLDALAAQLDKGDEADLDVVEGVEKKLQGDAKGLELKPFVNLRGAVGQWVDVLKIAQAPSLSEAALAAQANFRPISEQDVAASKAGVEAAAAKLGAYLKGANGAQWKDYLQWNDLQAQLKAEQPDPEVLAAVYRKLTVDQVGLEMPVFANVADALERYVNDLVGHNASLAEQYNEQLKTLAEALDKYGQDPTDENAIAVGSRLGWLENMQQAGPLVSAIRSRLSRPNLYVAVTERLVGAGIEQVLDEVAPVRDYILGTDIRGDGWMDGQVKAELVPNDDKAVFDTLLSGTVQSRTVGQNGPATIYSNGATAIAGRKRIVFNADGFASYPATAAANTSTRVTGIGGSGIVQRVAWKRVGQQKSQAERIAADHAADRVRERLNEQVGEQLSQAHADYLQKVRNPLVRRREFPELRFRTTDELLVLTGRAANRNQIAAGQAPPDVTVENDLAAQVHESMVNNLASALLGGRTVTEEELQQLVVDMTGELPDSLKSDEDRDPWSITFARSQPVTVKFHEEGIQVTIRGQRYTSGDRDFRAMDVTADYKYEIDGAGIKLSRQGELTIVPPGEPRRLSGKEITLRTLLEKRFGKLFEPEIKYEGLVLPGQWRKAGILDLKQAETKNGWFVLAWIESGNPAPPEEEKTPAEGDKVTQAPG